MGGTLTSKGYSVTGNSDTFQLPSGVVSSSGREQVFGQHWQKHVSHRSPAHTRAVLFSPMAFPLLKDSTTD